MERAGALDALVGEWTVTSDLLEAKGASGLVVFEWALHGAFLAQYSEAPAPIPDSLSIITTRDNGDGFTQHYFDERGVVRLYDMTIDDGVWTLTRTEPDFSPLDFSQRFIGRFDASGTTIKGRWEASNDGQTWKTDFNLVYKKRRKRK